MTAVAGSRPTVPSGPRTAWRVAASVAAVALVLWGTSQALTVLAHREERFTTSFPTVGVSTLEVDVASGSADVVAGDVDEITVTTRVSEGFRRTGHVQEVRGDRLVLTGTCPLFGSTFCSVHYDVVVPADLAVVADVADGRLSVEGLRGPVTAVTDDGSIEVRGVEGDLVLDSDNGSIRGDGLVAATVEASTENGSVTLGFATPPDLVVAGSENGSVEVRVPPVAGDYRVEADTDNGSSEVGVATDPGSDRLVRVTTDNGDVRVLPVVGAG